MGDFEQMLNDLCKMSKAQLVQMVKNTDEVEIALNIFKNVMKEDYARVLRCKDCKHSTLPSALTQRYGVPGTLTCHNRYSPCNRRNVGGEDFCSYGERREE